MDHFVGSKIKKIRLENKDTLKSLAEKIDYDWSNLSKVERGVYGVSLDILKKIAEVYNINPNYFLNDNFTEDESELLMEENLNASDLKGKYNLVIDGNPATEEEIEEMIKHIKLYRIMKQMESS